MRRIDYQLAQRIIDHWRSSQSATGELCALLADLPKLLDYLDSHNISPGNVIDPCPECGEEHRWALLKTLMINALDIFPPNTSRLMTKVDASLDQVRELYGGKEGYKEMSAAANKYFEQIDADNFYKP